MNLMPLVTIVMPAFNASDYINASIESVIHQTYSNWELIVVDDCSTDDTCKIVNDFIRRDSRIRLISLESNTGAAAARNIAIDNAKGRFIAFLDCDDVWYCEKLTKQIDFMLKNEYALSYTAYDVIDEKGHLKSEFFPPTEVSYLDLLRTCSIGCLTAIYDIQILGKVFMPLIRRRQDYALWLKILKQVPKAYGIEEKLAGYRQREYSVSSNKLKAAAYQWKVYREVERMNVFSSLFYFFQYAFAGLIKYK